MAGTTKHTLIATFQENILAQSVECKESDFAAMDGGAFFIGADNRNILIELLARKQAAGDYKMGLVPTIADKTIFFADVDHVPADFQPHSFLSLVAHHFNDLATDKVKEVNLNDIFVFKREDSARYHIYIPSSFGEVSKAVREAIYRAVNGNYAGNIIDEGARTIRIEGFEKYDRATKQFIAGSRYLPTGAAKDLKGFDLLDNVWLNPRGWDEQDEAILDDLLNDNDEEKSPSLDVVNAKIPADIEERIKTSYAEIAHILLGFPIISIRRLAGGQSTFMLDKSAAGRTCKIAGRVHARNNTYLCYYAEKRSLYQKCFSKKCTGKPPALIYKIPVNKAAFQEHDLPTADDASLADYFVKWNPLLAVEKNNKTYIWYMYNEAVGYWKKSQQAVVMQMLMKPFKAWLKAKFDAAIDKTDGDEDLIRAAGAVDTMLKTVRYLKAVAECVRWKLASDDKIEWNANPAYTVFPNGVLQLDKRDEARGTLYYFGRTKPEEYVNNSHCMKLPFNCPPVCNDGHYIEQANELMDDWIKLVQPEADDRCLLLMFLALVLKAINYKKMILNIGHSGDNAKSSFFEMVVYLLGSYGLTGDKCLIVKVKKDRVSKASLNKARFVLFEEPDAGKQLDVEFIKDLVGGAVESVGRFNFSNKNTVQLHCKTVLNANTMTSVQLESAIMNRLLFLAWTTQFTTDNDLIDPEKRIYKADEKFKTAAYWESVNDGFIWLLLNHYRMFELNDNKLRITAKQKRRTKAELLDNDLFIKWFQQNFVYLADTPSNRKIFVTQEEILAEFKLLAPAQQQQIIGRRNYASTKFIKDMVQIHSALKACYVKKITNWRLTLLERSAVKNVNGQNGQYQLHVLIRFIKRAEFESRPALKRADLADFEAKGKDEANLNDDNIGDDDYIEDDHVRKADGPLNEDYLLDSNLFFTYLDPACSKVVTDVAEQARALSIDVDDGVLVFKNDDIMNEDGVMVYNNEANAVLMNENGDNKGGNGNLINIDGEANDGEANDDLMNENSDNRRGNGNLMNVDGQANGGKANDLMNGNTDDRKDNSDDEIEEEAGVKDQAAKPKVNKRKRKKVKVTYKNSQYNGAAKKRRKKN